MILYAVYANARLDMRLYVHILAILMLTITASFTVPRAALGAGLLGACHALVSQKSYNRAFKVCAAAFWSQRQVIKKTPRGEGFGVDLPLGDPFQLPSVAEWYALAAYRTNHKAEALAALAIACAYTSNIAAESNVLSRPMAIEARTMSARECTASKFLSSL